MEVKAKSRKPKGHLPNDPIVAPCFNNARSSQDMTVGCARQDGVNKVKD